MYAVYHGPEGLRAIATRTHRYAAVLAAALGRGRRRGRARATFFDTLTVRVAGPRRRRWWPPRASAGLHLRLVDADRVGRQHVRAHHRPTLDAGAGRVRRHRRRPRRARPGHRRRAARRRCAGPRLPDPRGVLQPPQRDRDAALPAPALRPRLRARPRHDPARLLHDEAQRDDRDGAGLAARLRRPAPVRARPRTPPATAGWSTSSRAGWRRSPATTGSRSSPTPARRASSPGCWRSAATTGRAVRGSATSA